MLSFQVSGTRYLSTYPLLAAMQPSPNTKFPVKILPVSPPATSKLPTTRMSNLLDGGSPFYNVYTCADGRWFSVGCLEPQFYAVFLERFLAALPAAFLREQDLKLKTEDQYRMELWPRMGTFFEKAFRVFDRDHWTAVFGSRLFC